MKRGLPSVRLLTPLGESALAVLRFEGEAGRRCLEKLGCRRAPHPGEHFLCRIRAPGGTREPVLCFGDPRDGGIELHLHGNPYRLRSLFESWGSGGGASSGEPGRAERAAREWFEGEIERALFATALGAPTSEGCRVALAQCGPEGLAGFLRAARGESRVGDRWPKEETAGNARRLLARGEVFLPLFRPKVLAVLGPVNAGKSSLCNLLAGAERIRAGPHPGLTRDPVPLDLAWRGWPFRLLDTAGFPDRPASLDREAFSCGIEAAGRADLLLLCRPGSGFGVEREFETLLEAGGLSDLPRLRIRTGAPGTFPGTSCGPLPTGELEVDLAGDPPEQVRDRVLGEVCRRLGMPSRPPRVEAAWIPPIPREHLEELARSDGPGEDAPGPGGGGGGGVSTGGNEDP